MTDEYDVRLTRENTSDFMPGPLDITNCPNCGNVLTIKQIIRKGRCGRCGADLELTLTVRP